MYSNIVTDAGAIGDGKTDNTIAIQSALNKGGNWYFPAGTYLYSSTLKLNNNATGLFGSNMSTSILLYTGDSYALSNGNINSTLLFTQLSNLQFNAPNITLGFVLYLYSMQFSRLNNIWIIGSGLPGCSGMYINSNWLLTEATYNIIEGCYIGKVYNGLVFGDGANNCTISNSRFQTGISGGYGILAFPSAAGRSSCNSILQCGFEYPGQICNGINIAQNTNSYFLQGNRFESMNVGIHIGSTAIKTFDLGQYYSGCKTNKLTL